MPSAAEITDPADAAIAPPRAALFASEAEVGAARLLPKRRAAPAKRSSGLLAAAAEPCPRPSTHPGDAALGAFVLTRAGALAALDER